MRLTITVKNDLGIPDWSKKCPLCGQAMNLYQTKNTFGEDTYFLRCKQNSSCIFGDTKTITWLTSLEKKFNNRSLDFGECVAKKCHVPVSVRASHLCREHEMEYL